MGRKEESKFIVSDDVYMADGILKFSTGQCMVSHWLTSITDIVVVVIVESLCSDKLELYFAYTRLDKSNQMAP